MGKKKIYRCDQCDPPAIFYGRTPFDLDQRTHRRLALPKPKEMAPKRPPVCYDDDEAGSLTDEGESA